MHRTEAEFIFHLVHSKALVSELVHRLLDYGVLISSDQFDVIVKVVNSALIDEKVAMMLLPLTTIIYRVSVVAMETYRYTFSCLNTCCHGKVQDECAVAMETHIHFGNGRTHSWT